MKYLVILFIFCSLLAFVPSVTINDAEITTKAQLGEKLFFDPILSIDSSISCANCHKPEFAFADNVAISPGIDGKKGFRNAPSVMNMAFRNAFFYDGRAESLRDQVHFPIEDPMEMGFGLSDAVQRLRRHTIYTELFQKLYNQSPNTENVADAISAFEEKLETANTEFDAWMTDKPNTLSAEAIRGREIFLSDKAKCFDCHFSPDFTIDQFKNIGLYDDKKYKDQGRYLITKDSNDLGKFKVPGLRNVAVTAPYMHDGSFATLADVIDYYSDPSKIVTNPINLDTTLRQPIHFTPQEKSDLIAFLKSLTDRRFYKK